MNNYINWQSGLLPTLENTHLSIHSTLCKTVF